jgi:hypothetical protein
MFGNKGNRHKIKEVKIGNMVYIHPDSDLISGGWAMVEKISLTDEAGVPVVVDVIYPNGRKAKADEFMITEVR